MAVVPSIAEFSAILLVISPSICCADTGFLESLLVDNDWGTLSISNKILLLLVRGILCPKKTKTTIGSGWPINLD
jgi:hypothetical protein